MSTPIQYTYVEDYIEVMAGIYDVRRTRQAFFSPEPPIKLARYDTNVLASIAMNVATGVALSVKQADLCLRLITNYQRQLAKMGVDITPVLTPKYRLPLRVVNATRGVTVEEDELIIRFPYNEQMITQLREFGRTSQGHCMWDAQDRVWKLGLTEYNVSWVYTWGKQHSLALDERLVELFELIKAAEEREYSITLTLVDGALEITNAPESMLKYITDKVGGVNIDNLEWLVDNSGILGFEVDEGILQAINVRYDSMQAKLMTNRAFRTGVQPETAGAFLDEVIDYARTVGRLPILVLESSRPSTLGRYIRDKIGRPGGKRFYSLSTNLARAELSSLADKYDVVLGLNILTSLNDLKTVPLMMTDFGVILGPSKMLATQKAEKIIYLASFVHQSGEEMKGLTELKYEKTMHDSNQG